MKKNKIQETKKEPFEQCLKCVLNDEELLTIGSQLADEQKKLESYENELTEVRSSFKSRTDASKSNINRYSNMITSKSEYRTVKCEKIFDYKDGTVKSVRIDTDEILETREMTDEEKQMSLDLETK